MKNNIQAIILDIDGCLTPGKTQRADLSTLFKISRLVEKSGLPLSFCTGRSQPYTELFHQLLGVTKGVPSIVENGCFLYYAHKDEDYILENPGIKRVQKKVLGQIREEVILVWPRILSGKWSPGRRYAFL